MIRKIFMVIIAMIALLLCVTVFAARAEVGSESRIYLHEGWAVRPGDLVKESGEVIASAGFQPAGWYEATVPSTYLAVLLKNKVYEDLYYGKNLTKVPGSWPFPHDISSKPMPPFSPFRRPVWYRTEFQVPDSFSGQRIWLHLNGVTFRANLWVNGKQVASSDELAGTYTEFEYDITDLVAAGKPNYLALEVFPPHKNDLAETWVDWNPAPPDRDMGLWREVYIMASGPVTLRHPFVKTTFDLPSLEVAHLKVEIEAQNATPGPVSGTLKGTIGDVTFSQEVALAPGEKKTIVFEPEKFSQLNLKNPKLWWPAHLGPQNLYDLKLEMTAGGRLSDKQSTRFGVRQITWEMSPEEHKIISINGQRILIRGAGWASDMMFRPDSERMRKEIRYVKEMNLNTVRLEAKLEFNEFFDICDEEGILVMPGWCCCHHWERWNRWNDEDYKVAEASERTQILRLRNHPSVFVFLNGSDNPPPAKVEKMYLDVMESCDWPNAVISSATERDAKYSGPSGVKMNGPYEYVPPVYWYEDTKAGGAFGFNTETSPGPAVPPMESLLKILPGEHLWPIDEYWDFHCGRGVFDNLNVFTHALEERYGQAGSVEDYAVKSQAMTYEAERAMYEAFGRNKYQATGVIQWMLNNAWPSLVWHLYDYYLRPAGGYFGTKKACEPLHVQYSYDDRSVVVVNSYYQAWKNLKVTARLLSLDGAVKFIQTEIISVGPDSSTRVFNIPKPDDVVTVYFLKLNLEDETGKTVSDNFYWLPLKDETLNWGGGTWFYTPIQTFADYQDLQNLPKVELGAVYAFEKSDKEGVVKINLENPGRSIAFMVRLKINKGPGGEEILPVYYDDNYFSMLPGEKKTVTAKFYLTDLGNATPALAVEGWNIVPKSY